MKAKEEELNSIVIELRNSYASLQDRFTKEESDKLVSFMEDLFQFLKSWLMEFYFVIFFLLKN